MTRWRRAVLILISAGSMMAGAGCATAPQTSGLDSALAEYHAGRYAACRSTSNGLIAQTSGRERDEARYLAGLSAYRLGDLNEADRHLALAAQAPNPKLASNAKATMGLVRMDQRRPKEAAKLFEHASRGLSGSDATRAMQYAALAYGEAGDTGAARTWSSLARKSAAANPVREAPSSSTFVLQVGAFRERGRAEQAAAEARPKAQRIGLSAPRIVARSESNGATLWLVQLGAFSTRGEAARARERLGTQEYIVVPAAQRGT